ncbi:MAG: hydrogenase expression/formation protein HupK [Pseudomonadota bacterium]
MLRAQRAPGLPVARLVTGRRVDEVTQLLPRLFNLCRLAQSAAVEAALGHAVTGGEIREEILRDHLLKFHVTWPAFFGRSPNALPLDWAEGGAELCTVAFGPSGIAPATGDDFFAFLDSGLGYAPILKMIDDCFGSGEAVADGVPGVTPETLWTEGLVDNSVAVRNAGHPAMAAIADRRGHGPLWRAAARLYDIAAMIDDDVPAILTPAEGEAIVPAARGSYGVRIACDSGVVTAFERITPTDHLLADGGVLDRTLQSLPADRAALGPLLLDILDPCSPVRLKEVGHA